LNIKVTVGYKEVDYIGHFASAKELKSGELYFIEETQEYVFIHPKESTVIQLHQ
jgi:hypothetical protein